MKKAIIFLFAAGLMASCNNAGDGADTKKDSTVQAIDSTVDAKKDSLEQAGDSLKNKVENTYEKTDSANKAIADSTAKASKK